MFPILCQLPYDAQTIYYGVMTTLRRNQMRFAISIIIILTLSILSLYFFRIQGFLTERKFSNPFQTFSAAALQSSNLAQISKTPMQSLVEAEKQEEKFQYIEVVDSCGPEYGDECLLVRSGPGVEHEVVHRFRTGMVLRAKTVTNEQGEVWYKIIFDEWLRYEDRVISDMYVAAEFVEVFYDQGIIERTDNDKTTDKEIIIDRSEQKLYAYDNEVLFMETSISTGLELTPTPRGTFPIFRKTPSRYMQGPLPNLADKQIYDLPGVPWTLYFTTGGAAIHGTYWHDNFGEQQSHGCVNLSPAEAKKLYKWAPVGTVVTVQN